MLSPLSIDVGDVEYVTPFPPILVALFVGAVVLLAEEDELKSELEEATLTRRDLSEVDDVDEGEVAIGELRVRSNSRDDIPLYCPLLLFGDGLRW